MIKNIGPYKISQNNRLIRSKLHKVKPQNKTPNTLMYYISVFFSKYIQLFMHTVSNLQMGYSNIFRILQLLMSTMILFRLIYDSYKDLSTFITFPRITMVNNFGDFNKFLSFISSFLCQLPSSIFFMVISFNHTSRKLKTKFSKWWSKISNQHQILRSIFPLQDWNDFHSIDCCIIFPCWAKGHLIIIYNLVSNTESNLLNSKPFFLANNLFTNDFTALQILFLHIIINKQF